MLRVRYRLASLVNQVVLRPPTVWHPDTCQCVIQYTVDDAAPDTLVYVKHDQICPDHQSLFQDNSSRWNAAQDDNKAKGLIRQAIVANLPALVDADGNPAFTYSFDPVVIGKGRRLRLGLGPSVTGQQRAALQQALNAALGAGRVVVG